jgi:hypothetical protein
MEEKDTRSVADIVEEAAKTVEELEQLSKEMDRIVQEEQAKADS